MYKEIDFLLKMIHAIITDSEYFITGLMIMNAYEKSVRFACIGCHGSDQMFDG